MSVNQLRVSVSGTSESPTKLAVSVRDFSLVIDEPAAFGGTDAGLTEHDATVPNAEMLRTASGAFLVQRRPIA